MLLCSFHIGLYMIIRMWNIVEITSLRETGMRLIFNPQTALCLSVAIEVNPLWGFFVMNADIHPVLCRSGRGMS